MGCYGLGPSRLMGTIVECLADEKGLVWPESPLKGLTRDRQGPQAGEKLADADLIGIADRIVVSRKTLTAGGVEWKARLSNECSLITLEKLHEILRRKVEIPHIVTS